MIWGDNLYVMSSLLEKFAGKINLIYIDPPFATGADFKMAAEVGEGGDEINKDQSMIEEKVYRDTWGKGTDSYLSMLYDRLMILYDLLSENGSIYIHCDYRLNSHIRFLCDEIFGPEKLLNQIIWGYTTGGIPEKNGFSKKHDDILLYTKSEAMIFNRLLQKSYVPTLPEPHTNSGKRLGVKRDEICELCGVGKPGQKYREVIMRDVWTDIKSIFRNDEQSTSYPTQKPEALLERIINASSNENDLIADFFCGSGTTLAVAEKLNRRWLGCDLSRFALQTTRKRMMDIDGCKPFEILNLGKYERQAWQGVVFGESKQEKQLAIFEYLKFILELYGAMPLAGTTHLHGKKGQSMVHVGAVDAPVTFDEINACLDECETMRQKSLNILGWEWEMGVANNMVDMAKGRGINLLLLNIPREVMEKQAVDKGDIYFYELAYLEIEKIVKGKKAQIKLTDFNIPNDELIPPDVREKIKKWSDYVDYWAVDWDFQNDAFVNGWTDYRTPHKRELKLSTDPHTYEKDGTYQVMVKVIDIFGNDTSQIFPLEITA